MFNNKKINAKITANIEKHKKALLDSFEIGELGT